MNRHVRSALAIAGLLIAAAIGFTAGAAMFLAYPRLGTPPQHVYAGWQRADAILTALAALWAAYNFPACFLRRDDKGSG